MNVMLRSDKIDWLKADAAGQHHAHPDQRPLPQRGRGRSRARRGHLPHSRDSQIDVVQSVGRVMRKLEGKQYGYIILPIAVPAGVEPDKALNDNKQYKVVWEVLQALRAHDERFDAMVDQLELNQATHDTTVQVIGVKDFTPRGEGAGRHPAGPARLHPARR